MTEHDDCIAPRHLILVGTERAPERRRHSHCLEKVSADQHADPSGRQIPRVCGKRDSGAGKGNQRFERGDPLPDVKVFGIGRLKRPAVDVECAGRDNRVGFRHRQWPQQQGVGEAEDRAVRADSNRQRSNRDQREGRCDRECANPIPDVAREVLEPRQATLIPHRLHCLGDTGVSRASAVRICFELEMGTQFPFEIRVVAPRPDGLPQPDAPFAKGSHVRPPFIRARGAACA